MENLQLNNDAETTEIEKDSKLHENANEAVTAYIGECIQIFSDELTKRVAGMGYKIKIKVDVLLGDDSD